MKMQLAGQKSWVTRRKLYGKSGSYLPRSIVAPNTNKMSAGTKRSIIAALRRGEKNEKLQKKYSASRQQIAAIKAHITMGTY